MGKCGVQHSAGLGCIQRERLNNFGILLGPFFEFFQRKFIVLILLLFDQIISIVTAVLCTGRCLPCPVARIFGRRAPWDSPPPRPMPCFDCRAFDRWHRQYCTSPPSWCSHRCPRRTAWMPLQFGTFQLVSCVKLGLCYHNRLGNSTLILWLVVHGSHHYGRRLNGIVHSTYTQVSPLNCLLRWQTKPL